MQHGKIETSNQMDLLPVDVQLIVYRYIHEYNYACVKSEYTKVWFEPYVRRWHANRFEENDPVEVGMYSFDNYIGVCNYREIDNRNYGRYLLIRNFKTKTFVSKLSPNYFRSTI
jgi:hypothetical protein